MTLKAHNICREKTCKVCTIYVSVAKSKDGRSYHFCKGLLGIANCCSPFMASQNTLVPVSMPQKPIEQESAILSSLFIFTVIFAVAGILTYTCILLKKLSPKQLLRARRKAAETNENQRNESISLIENDATNDFSALY